MITKVILTFFTALLSTYPALAQQCPSGYLRGKRVQRIYYRVNWEGEEPVICNKNSSTGMFECKDSKLSFKRHPSHYSIIFKTSDGDNIIFGQGKIARKDDNYYDYENNRFVMRSEWHSLYRSRSYPKRLKFVAIQQQIQPCKKVTL
jgi:hypothetical protein